MIQAYYNKERNFDELLEKIIKSVYQKLNVDEDDFLLLCCGSPGTGKSMLMLHALRTYMKELASADFIGLDKSSFANAMKTAKDKPLPRFVGNDEANISKRDSLSKYNKYLIDMYLSIRGLRIFHWWSNPSMDIIDKHFIEERIKGVIFITTKDKDRPRIYYYFRKQDLLKIWEKYGNLKLNQLNKIKKEYAFFKGWFKDYPMDDLRKAYQKKKDSRMDFKVEEFFEKYGEEEELIKTQGMLKPYTMCRLLGITRPTLKKYAEELKESKEFKEELISYMPDGTLIFNKECVSIFGKMLRERKYKKMANLRNLNNAYLPNAGHY